MINYKFLIKTSLFWGVSEKEAEDMLKCLGAHTQKYLKDEVVFPIGKEIFEMGLVLEGSVNIVKEDVWGNRNIIDNIEVGQVFGEAYSCIRGEQLMGNVIAAENCQILFINAERVTKTCSSGCEFHSRLVHNLLSVISLQNLKLTRKINHITQKSTKDKVLSYLSYQAMKQGKYAFDVPFNRQEMADYLSVERSALSNELSRMQKEGLISYRKNHFVLHCGTEDYS